MKRNRVYVPEAAIVFRRSKPAALRQARLVKLVRLPGRLSLDLASAIKFWGVQRDQKVGRATSCAQVSFPDVARTKSRWLSS